MKRTLVLTSPHMTGDDVKYAQRVLKKHGGYYEGKAEMHHLLYSSPRRSEAWTRDPSEAMLEKDWLKQGPMR